MFSECVLEKVRNEKKGNKKERKLRDFSYNLQTVNTRDNLKDRILDWPWARSNLRAFKTAGSRISYTNDRKFKEW